MYGMLEFSRTNARKESSRLKAPKKPTLNEGILKLYDSVISLYGAGFVLCKKKVQKAVRQMNRNYKCNAKWKHMEEYRDIDFISPSYRWVYLFKYAKCHTGLTHKLLYEALYKDKTLRGKIDARRRLNLCSLGGGPGCDIVAILHAFTRFFGPFRCSVSVIDNAMEWKRVFAYIVEELREGKLGQVKSVVSRLYFEYEYINANLLWDLKNYPEVKQRITDADFISMVMFVSASACWRTPAMLQEIFSCMKPGALIMYIDNSDGRFLKAAREVAYDCGLKSAYGPILCFRYVVPFFKKRQLGCDSAYKAKVSFEIWEKLEKNEALRKRRRTGSRRSGESEPDTPLDQVLGLSEDSSVAAKSEASCDRGINKTLDGISDDEMDLPLLLAHVLRSVMGDDESPESDIMLSSEQTLSTESSIRSNSMDSEELLMFENLSGTSSIRTSISVPESSLLCTSPNNDSGTAELLMPANLSETAHLWASINVPDLSLLSISPNNDSGSDERLTSVHIPDPSTHATPSNMLETERSP